MHHRSKKNECFLSAYPYIYCIVYCTFTTLGNNTSRSFTPVPGDDTEEVDDATEEEP
jgi:hypothetical protein